MVNQTKTSVSPKIYFLGQIIELISIGELRVPNFQRPFVWKPEDMIALFESIENGYPIGSLLFWKTQNKYNILPNIGPYKIPDNKTTNINLILDGHQRLSTLYGILSNPNKKTIFVEENYWRWELYYDLKDRMFLHIRKGNPEPHYIKLNSLLKTIDFLKEANRINVECKVHADKYIERAEKLAQIFREYQIATTQIDGGDLDSAVNIFSRLNSKGTPISEDRMYSALTYKEGKNQFNLSVRIDDILEKLSDYSFGGIKRMSIFRSILAAAGKNIYTKGRLNIFEDKKLDIPLIVNNCEQSLIKAVRFLKEEIRVPDDKFLPYNLQLIVLSEFFRLNPNPSNDITSLVKQWFWVTSYVGLDTPNTSKTRQVVEEMREFAKSNDANYRFKLVNFDDEAQPFPSRFNLTSARVRVYVLFLLSLNPKSLNGLSFDPDNALKEGYKALPYIISRGSQLSNRILLGNVKYGFAKKILKRENGLFGNGISEETLNSHAINLDAYSAIQNGYEEQFLELREKELIKSEREFMESKGVRPSNIISPQEPLIDTE